MGIKWQQGFSADLKHNKILFLTSEARLCFLILECDKSYMGNYELNSSIVVFNQQTVVKLHEQMHSCLMLNNSATHVQQI